MADPAVPHLESCLVIANPTAGTVTRELIDDVVEGCARYTDVRLARTSGRGDATALAAEAAGARAGPECVWWSPWAATARSSKWSRGC